MKFLLDNWFLVLAAMGSGLLLLWPTLTSGGGAGAVSAAQAVQLVNREKGVLIDVSEPAEFATRHAQGARNVPFGQLEGSKSLPSNKAVPLVVVCPTGARAGRAAAALRKLGYERAQALAGGTRAWTDANLPVAKGA